MDVHWWSASNVDCVSTNPDALPGLLPVLLVTISGDRSVYTLQPVSFEFVKGKHGSFYVIQHRSVKTVIV